MNRRIAYLSTSIVPRMVAAGLSAPARLVLLSLLANPDTSVIGVHRSGTDQLSIATGQPRSSVRRALIELEERGFVIRALSTGEIHVPGVIDGLDEARQVQLTNPINSWWTTTGYQTDPELRKAPIASDRIRASVVEHLGRVAT